MKEYTENSVKAKKWRSCCWNIQLFSTR